MKVERRVPSSEHASIADLFDWQSAHIFLEISEAGSFRSAAEKLGLSVNALRRQLAKLERDMGAILLTRHVDGVRLTTDGERALSAARAMQAASYELLRGREPGSEFIKGEVKLATTDGLGTFWIAPQILRFREHYPHLAINLHCSMTPVDVLRLEADIAVQLTRPTAKDLKIVKLGRLHAMTFVSRGYIARCGKPTIANLAQHRVVWQHAEQVTLPHDFPPSALLAQRLGLGALSVNASGAHYMAVASGLGIGSLPTYVPILDKSLVPVELDILTHHDIWLVYHPDAGRIPRVQAVTEWLIEIFSPKACPWFADNFIHPDDLRASGPYDMKITWADGGPVA